MSHTMTAGFGGTFYLCLVFAALTGLTALTVHAGISSAPVTQCDAPDNIRLREGGCRAPAVGR
jgi:hypothetical protein